MKQWGWKRWEAAETMRPAMGRAQEAHWAVGRLWKGDQCGVELVMGAVDE